MGPTSSSICVPRQSLVSELGKLSALQSAEQDDLRVHMRVEGLGADAELQLQARDPSGKGIGVAVLGCRRTPGEGVHGNLPLFRGLVSVKPQGCSTLLSSAVWAG
jgi:hypothetical protein